MGIKKTIWIGDEAEQTIKEHNIAGEINWSGTINELIKRYDFFSITNAPDLKECERNAMFEITNGRIPNEDLSQEVKSLPWAVSDGIEYNANFVHLLESGGVNPQDFLKKVKSWSDAQRLAVIGLCERFWAQGQKENSDQLKSVDKIKAYSSNIVIHTTDGDTLNLEIEKKEGLYTKDEWQNNETILTLDDDSQEQVFKVMEKASNNFFKINTEKQHDR